MKKRLLSLLLVTAVALSWFAGCTPADSKLPDVPPATEEFRLFDENGKPLNPPRGGVGENAIVSTSKYEASVVGRQILEQGGNAVDAAVASAFALGVVEPFASGLGGGGFMTYRDGKTGETVFIDFREVAPGASTPDMYKLDENGDVIDNASVMGGLANAVPGEVAGLLYILETYGTMSRREVMQPAIDLATEGFVITPFCKAAIDDNYKKMIDYPELGEIYLKDGLPPAVGDIIKNPDLAKTLGLIADNGAEVFYTGEIADAIVATNNKYGGIMTKEDLANYKIELREPVTGTYRGYKIISSPPPSSGGAHLIQILNMLENYDLSEYGQYSAEHMHLLSEIFKLTYADRAAYMGDPEYIDVPLAGITDKDYAAELVKKIEPDVSKEYEADDPWAYESNNTTHLSVADKEGNMIGITKTINYYYGSGLCVDGYGFVMNNEMDDFSPVPGGPNSVAPGKKPLSSMTPTVILNADGTPFMVLGCPGGSAIFPVVAQVVSNVIDYGMDIQDAINMPRILDDLDNVLWYQDGIDSAEIAKLEEWGHTLYHLEEDTFGYVQAAHYPGDGKIHGGADPFIDGKALGN